MSMSNRIADVVQTAAQVISRPFASFFEKTGTDMEPDPAECSREEPHDEQLPKNHLFRLFIGWVPKLFTERDLLPLFQKYGEVKDIIILKDKVSGQPRGCAFVSYATKEEADAAIHALDKGVHLPGALCPIEVRYARSHLYIQAGAGPQDNRQLFFARAPVMTSEEELKQLFGQFGQVEMLNLFRERRTHASKGCGFVTMGTREQAVAAMNALDEKHLMEGSTTQLAVKWADPELQIKKKRAVEDSNADNRMLFFAKVLRSASEDEVRELFAQFGRVVEVNLFRAFQGAPTTKGCGLVTMGSNDEAAAAIAALDSQHVWEGMEAPMVVKWMDAALQKRRREEHLLALRAGQSPTFAISSSELYSSGALNRAGSSSMAAAVAGPPSSSRSAAGLSQGKLLEAAAAAAAAAAGKSFNSESSLAAMTTGNIVTSGSFAGAVCEPPPVGCAPDAYKLFVGNIPKSYTEENLRPVFESIGPVVELVVVRDKFTHESKGSAFVWYRTRADADQAVLQYNLCRILSDPMGEQTRPLVVRRANMRKPAAAVMATGSNPASHPSMLSSSTAAAGTGPSGISFSAAGPAAVGSSGSLGGVMDLTGLGSGMTLGSIGGPEVPMHLQPMAAIQIQQRQKPADQFQGAPQVAIYTPAYQTGADNTGGTALIGQYAQGNIQAALGTAATPPTLLQQVQQVQVQQQQVQQHMQPVQQVQPVQHIQPVQQAQQHMQPVQQVQQHMQPVQQLQQVQQHMQPVPQVQTQPYFLTAQGTAVLPAQVAPVANASYGAAAAFPGPSVAAAAGLAGSGSGGVVPVAADFAGCASGPVVQMSLQLTAAQMMSVSGQLYSVSAMSGADLSTVPVAGGVYYVTLTGARSQVESARQLLSGLINQMHQAGVV